MIRTYWRFVVSVIKAVLDDDCSKHAAALTYTTLFAIVPLLTVTFNMFALVPAFQGVAEQVQSAILENVVPTTSQEIEGYLTGFISQARKLTFVGFAFLAVTSFLLLRNIDQTLNQFWSASQSRKGLTVFLTYWTVLSLGPLLLGVAIGINAYLVSLTILVEKVDVIGLFPTLLEYGSYGLSILAFTCIYFVVPNVPIKITHALIGGFFTASVIELAQSSFAMMVGGGSYQNIYGAFAFLPLFFLWIYLTWMIILIGAQVVRGLAVFNFRDESLFSNVVVSFKVLELLWLKHQQGLALTEDELLDEHWMFGRYLLDGHQWEELRHQLLESGLIETNGEKEYFLKKDLGQVSLMELLEVVSKNELVNSSDWETNFSGSHQLDANQAGQIDKLLDQLSKANDKFCENLSKPVLDYIASDIDAKEEAKAKPLHS